MAAGGIDRQIAEAVAAAGGLTVSKLGLRFDRVVIAVLGRLRRFAEGATPAGKTVLVTISAPIRLPAKTATALEAEIAALVSSGAVGHAATLCGNQVRLRLVEHSPGRDPKLVGFVHNPGIDAASLLDHAAAWVGADP